MRRVNKIIGGVLATMVMAVVSTMLGAQTVQPARIEGVDAKLLEELVAAGRILARLGVLDAFGHVSARHPGKPDRFLMSRSIAPAQATLADIVELDANGEPVDTSGRKLFLERYIHAEIYKKRPDAMAVVHSHSPSVVTFSVTAVPLRPVGHTSAFLYKGAPVFDIRAVEPASNMLIVNNKLGRALAETLGGASVALLRGHGDVVVGGSIPNAVSRAYYTEVNARIQRDAMILGGSISFLSEEEGRHASETIEPGMDRAWDLWRAEIGPVN
jgi:ribulose-5-phosphate 4-epimerase/fuculose-1-phosphate aldolase